MAFSGAGEGHHDHRPRERIRGKGHVRPERTEDPSANYKIRAAQLEKIPYMLVLGDKEIEAGTVSVRTRDGKVMGNMKLDEFAGTVAQEIRARKS